MRQVPIPEGEYPRVSQFTAEKPYHYVITPGYKPCKEACERASKMALSMMNKEKDNGTFNPVTFVTNVWQKSLEYRETDRLWKIYRAEAEKKLRQEPIKIVRKNVGDALAA